MTKFRTERSLSLKWIFLLLISNKRRLRLISKKSRVCFRGLVITNSLICLEIRVSKVSRPSLIQSVTYLEMLIIMPRH